MQQGTAVFRRAFAFIAALLPPIGLVVEANMHVSRDVAHVDPYRTSTVFVLYLVMAAAPAINEIALSERHGANPWFRQAALAASAMAFLMAATTCIGYCPLLPFSFFAGALFPLVWMPYLTLVMLIVQVRLLLRQAYPAGVFRSTRAAGAGFLVVAAAILTSAAFLAQDWGCWPFTP